jgi:hypothetical protein
MLEMNSPLKISVTAKPSAKKQSVEQTGAAHFAISVKEPPQGGRANRAIAKALAKHLGVPLPRLRLVSGASSKRKIFEVR